jgi:CRISPR/Cas system CSM-associated protein Csm3 (group 7 of RAMP superfamily)
MIEPRYSGNSSRKIVKRIVVEGTLKLLSPTHLGNGETSDLTDMPLVIDPVDGKTPLLTGASIAGALRSALHSTYTQPGQSIDPTAIIFGADRTDSEGEQSRLIIDDAYSSSSGVEYRTNVRLDPKSRTAEQDGLFNFQYWQAGTSFELHFELAIYAGEDEKFIEKYFAFTLAELEEEGRISLGAKKTSGFGLVKVKEWKVKEYDLTTPGGLNDWLQNGMDSINTKPGSSICQLLGVVPLTEKRRELQIDAVFQLEQALLIHSGNDFEESGADKVQLKTKTNTGQLAAVLPGTSWRGALHNRAKMIYAALELGQAGDQHLESLFGTEIVKGKDPRASRIRILESIVPGNSDLIQPRVSIDPFTGGAKSTALFFDQPVFADSESKIKLSILIKNATRTDLGLCLLLIKDLWSSDLAFGSKSNVGRGRLTGISAEINYQDEKISGHWIIDQDKKDSTQLLFDPRDSSFLTDCVTDLKKNLEGGK